MMFRKACQFNPILTGGGGASEKSVICTDGRNNSEIDLFTS